MTTKQQQQQKLYLICSQQTTILYICVCIHCCIWSSAGGLAVLGVAAFFVG